MKHCILFPLLVLLLINTSNAKELKIKASLFSGTWFSTSNKYYIVDVNIKEFEEIIKDCPDCIDKYNSYQEKQSTAFVLGLVGGLTIVGSLVVGVMEGMQHGGNPDRFGSLLLFLGGTTSAILSCFVQSSALTDIEEIAPIYNKAQSKQSDNKKSKWEYGLLIGENKVMIGFTYTF